MVQPKSNRLLVESQIGAPLGVAGLGVDAKLPDAQLPDRLGAGVLGQYIVRLPASLGVDGTAAIQAALNAAKAAGGGTVFGFGEGSVYTVSKTGTTGNPVTNPSGTAGAAHYAIRIPSNVYFDLNGATLKAAAGGSDYSLVVNEVMNATTDKNLGIGNGTVDANGVTQPGGGAGGMTFVGVTGLRLWDLTVKNAYKAGIQTWAIDRPRYSNVTVTDIVGNGMTLGQPQAGKGETNGVYGTLIARNITPWPANTYNYPGNSVYGVFQNATIDRIVAENCTGGIKFGDPCADITLGSAFLLNGGDGNGNSGMKIQGTASSKSKRISIGQIQAKGCAGVGLYIEQYAEDVQIGQYQGYGNSTLGGWPDVWVGAPRTQIDQIHSTNAGSDGVQVRDQATDFQFGQVLIRNYGQVSGPATAANSTGYNQTAGSGAIDSLVVVDDQATATANRGVSVSGGSFTAARLKATGMGTPLVLYTATTSYAQNPRVSADAPFGEITPAAAATSTVVANGNFVTFGSQFTPVVEIQPLNAAARALTGLHWTYAAGALTIRHSAAAGTEKIRWRLIGYVSGVTAQA